MSELRPNTLFRLGQTVKVRDTEYQGVVKEIDETNRVLELDIYSWGECVLNNVPYAFDEVDAYV